MPRSRRRCRLGPVVTDRVAGGVFSRGLSPNRYRDAAIAAAAAAASDVVASPVVALLRRVRIMTEDEKRLTKPVFCILQAVDRISILRAARTCRTAIEFIVR
jgi:hypothetical protein